jgi:hypothetical protein
MKIGFTGTRRGMTTKQLAAVHQYLSADVELHHGDCIGADSQMHAIAQTIGCRIILHPPSDTALRAWSQGAHYIFKPLNYIKRNHDIVDISDALIAAPYEVTEKLRGSGTWATIRYARKVNKPTIIIYPNGEVAEWSIAPHPKCGVHENVPGVQIPPSPPKEE